MEEVPDGPEALQLAYEHQPDVAVLDIAMPHLNGLETARWLRKLHVHGTATVVRYAIRWGLITP